MKHLTYLIITAALSTHITYASQSEQQEMLTMDTYSIEEQDKTLIFSENSLNISEELNYEIGQTLKKDYIIFHEQIWGTLPNAERKTLRHRTESTKNREHTFIGNEFDGGNFAILANLIIHDKSKISLDDTLEETLKYGILPALFKDGIKEYELNSIELIENKKLDRNGLMHQMKIKFRDEIIEAFYILERKSPGNTQRVFSISQISPQQPIAFSINKNDHSSQNHIE